MNALEGIMTILVLAAAIGCIALYKKNPQTAGKLGVWVIVLSGMSFAIQVISFGLTKEGAERFVLICTAFLATPVVAYYWFKVWQRKRPDAKT
jgi:multisubunit Na+/H+ antiporter MnhG subunit